MESSVFVGHVRLASVLFLLCSFSGGGQTFSDAAVHSCVCGGRGGGGGAFLQALWHGHGLVGW